MKTVKKEELYRNLNGFLKSKGIELKEGSYVRSIRKACGFLAEAVNATQKGVSRAKKEVDKKLGRLRKSIHTATAPRQSPFKAKRRSRTKSGSAKAKTRSRRAAPRTASRARRKK